MRSDVTRVLEAMSRGDPRAAGKLLPLVYDELRRLAAEKMAHERPGHTLQATALVHEAYIRLVSPLPSPPSQGGDTGGVQWDSRAHFFAAAAEAMPRILIDNARRKRRPKHGGDRKRIDLNEGCMFVEGQANDLLDLDEALTKLAAEEPAKAELVKLRCFAGCSLDEAASLLGISLATAKRHWVYARAWLYAALNDLEEQ